MLVLIRALTYASVFVGFVLVFLPARVLQAAGVTPPESLGPREGVGLVVAAAGGLLAVGCVLTFAVAGGGTPAPFDPPRRLVVRGPYGVVRNPMYLGAALALGGASAVYRSAALAGYAAGFALATHLFVVLYEEPALRRAFGSEYEAYTRRVARWLPWG